VVFLIGALAGVTVWLIFAEARRDMDSFVRNFPSSSDASSTAPATYPKLRPGAMSGPREDHHELAGRAPEDSDKLMRFRH